MSRVIYFGGEIEINNSRGPMIGDEVGKGEHHGCHWRSGYARLKSG